MIWKQLKYQHVESYQVTRQFCCSSCICKSSSFEMKIAQHLACTVSFQTVEEKIKSIHKTAFLTSFACSLFLIDCPIGFVTKWWDCECGSCLAIAHGSMSHVVSFCMFFDLVPCWSWMSKHVNVCRSISFFSVQFCQTNLSIHDKPPLSKNITT